MNEILDNTFTGEIQLIRASRTKRFINVLVDQFALYILILAIGFQLALTDEYDESLYLENEPQIDFLSYVIGWGVSLLFYTLMEGLLKGKTLGKFITKTRALDEQGELLTFSNAFIRSLCRLIPFEAFTFLGEKPGLHDRLSKTMVVEDNETVKEHINRYF